MNRTTLSIGTLALLTACSMGPWNTEPGTESVELPQLSASNFLVAGRGYDTLWITRSLSFSATRDSLRWFVDTANSSVRIIRLDGPGAPDTIPYRLSGPLAGAWLPLRSDDTARHGSSYRLEAHLRWDSAQGWGAGARSPEWKSSDLWAQTYTPRVFSEGKTLFAPVEALLPAVASLGGVGLFAYPTNSPILGKLGLNFAARDSVTKGYPVYRPIHDGDTVCYITSSEPVIGLNGAPNIRQNRSFKVPLTLDRPRFGGVLEFQRFDSTAARMLDPITRALQNSTGMKFDSTRYYQKGQWRFVDFIPPYAGPLLGWPDTLQIPNLAIGYTGWNILYAYSVDTLYEPHYNGLAGGLQLAYTNIHGGNGYFTGSAVDSIRLFVQAAGADTFSVQALRGAWCRKRREKIVDSVQTHTLKGDTTSADGIWLSQRTPQCFDLP